MHLTLIISSLNPGGAERILSELANYWVSQGHQITLVTLASPETKPFYFLEPKIHLIQLDQSQAELSLFMRLRNIFRRIFYMRKTIRILNPEMVVSFVDVMNITTLIATIGLKIPTLVSERIDPNFHKIPKLYSWLRFKIYPFASRIVVQTHGAAKYFPEKFKPLIKIIPNPVKIPKLQKVKYSERITKIVTTGRLDPQKDHKTLIHAFYHLLQHHPYLTLTIYGEGQERVKLEELVTYLNLEDKVHLPGVIKDIEEALLNADLFIFPSLYEGFPNALCEAMAAGLPVIASNCSGNIDIVQDGINGRLFPVGKIEILTEIVLELLSDSAQSIYLAENAKKVCDNFESSYIFSAWDKCLCK
jgi:glycosyltransferase involved in cell wall biosynthesis